MVRRVTPSLQVVAETFGMSQLFMMEVQYKYVSGASNQVSDVLSR